MSDVSTSDVRAWMAARAVPLRSLVPGTDTTDLAAMRAAWSGARVIGLGEATHGTREFFTLKHRLIAYLVLELGTRVFAVEASESAAMAVDDYVTHGHGDPRQALAGLGFWTLRTREFLALLHWLREHNAALPEEDRVRFVGIDPQRPAAATGAIERVLADTFPEELARYSDALRKLRDSGMSGPALPESVLHRIEALSSMLEHCPDEEGLRTRDRAAVLVRAARLATAPREGDSIYARQDALMAQAVTELAKTVPTAGPAIVAWAHNGHIRASHPSQSPEPLGAHLRREFGEQYYALGLLFGSGTFRANRKRLLRGPTSTPVRHRRGHAPAMTVEGHLARAKTGNHLIDLREQNPPEPVTGWLATPTFTRQHGAVETPYYRLGYTPTTPGEEYDGFAYISSTNQSAPCD